MNKLEQSKDNADQKVSDKMGKIHCLINQCRFREALEIIKGYESKNPNDKTLQFNKPGFLIDIGFGLKDPDIIINALKIGENNLTNEQNEERKINLHYNLANGYSDLFKLVEKVKGLEAIPQSENLQKVKNHLRQAVAKIDNCDYNLRKKIWTNFGNCLDNLGRGVESLYAYDEALRIDKKYSMAICNKAEALCYFAGISGKYKTAILDCAPAAGLFLL